VKDGYNGFLVKPKSVEGLVEAIITLLNDKELCIKMGQNGRKLIEKHFTQEKIASETIAVWKEVLAS
jgi:glycosyltransferase involved in cell wall biosynthesis